MSKKNAIVIGVVGLILFTICLIVILEYYSPKYLKIVSVKWYRGIDLEIYKTVREEGWDIPNGGREISSRRKKSGTACMPFGKTQMCTPTYDDWYAYDIDKWIKAGEFINSGNDKRVSWPECKAKIKVPKVLGSERCGARHQWYKVFVEDSNTNEQFEYNVSELEFYSWNIKDLASGRVVFGKLIKLHHLEEN